MPAVPPPGSIEAAAARLVMWATLPGEGFIRASFTDPQARDNVLRAVRSRLPASIPFHILNVPQGNAEASARYLIAELPRLGPGLVSIHGIGDGLPPTDDSASRVLHAFNAFRERFRVPGQQSIWWLPPHISRAFTYSQRDLASWFLKQFELTESLPPERPDTGRAFGTRRIYLSMASAEYRDLRGKLDTTLRRAGFNTESQEIFPQLGGSILRSLSELIASSAIVIHIVGHQPGSVAGPQAVSDLLTGIPAENFLYRYPELRAALGDFSGITYTQWEALLALHYGIPLLVYAPADAFVNGKPAPDFAQSHHSARLRLARRYAQPCDGEAGFLATILADLYQHTRTTEQTGKPINLPYTTLGSLFKGREKFLASLRYSLTHDHAAFIRGAHAIHGTGGVGKTRTAIEYAWQHENNYTALLFITADTPESLQRNFAALAGPLVLNLPEQDSSDIHVQIHAVINWLQQHPGWLLILDNVDTEEARKAVTSLLPQLSRGHILITSRLADWPAGVTSLDLEVLSEDSSVDFLLQRTYGRRIHRDDDHATARTLARTLGGLALALDQCAAWIRQQRCSFADYLKAWESRRYDVLRWHDSATHLYPRSIAVTYATSISQLTPDAGALLDILSWLAPDPMPLRHLENLNALPDPRGLLMELCDLHLATLSADGTTFSVHRLLQEITRQQQDAPIPPALLTALTWVNAEMPGHTYDVHTWPVAVPLLPHALALATTAAQRGLSTPTARLLNVCATLLKTQANYPAAEPLFRRALALAEKHHGENHPETSIYLNNLATLLQDLNRLAEAEPIFRRALAIDEASFGPGHPKVALRLNNLATLLHGTNRLAEAEPLYRRALAINEAFLGEKHPQVANCLNNLAQLLKDTDRLAEAEPLMRRALVIDEASFGPDHPNVARDINNLAQLLKDTNRLAEAEPLFRRALDVDEASFGPDHPNVARDLNNLAQLLQDTNRMAEAEPLIRRALAIDEASLVRDHPNVAIRLNNLATLLRDTDRREEAEPMMARALHIFEDSLGTEHPNSVTVRQNLAILRKEMQS